MGHIRKRRGLGQEVREGGKEDGREGGREGGRGEKCWWIGVYKS